MKPLGLAFLFIALVSGAELLTPRVVLGQLSDPDQVFSSSVPLPVDEPFAEAIDGTLGPDATAWEGDYIDLPRVGGPTIDIEYGSRRPLIDGIGWVVGIPRKLLLWDSRADNHQVSSETTQDISAYLADRQLSDVKVRVNQYAPIEEWKRLVANKRVGAGWRYTIGLLKQVEYTLLPGRIFGGDEYNPYTNSLYVYSDVPALGLAESAYAKDVHQRDYPGTYATAQTLPIIAMWHETLATQEVLQYVAIRGEPDEIASTRRILYARYGMELGGELDSVVSPSGVRIGGLYQVIGAVGGHVAAGVENVRETSIRR
ncbi:MAG: hypothetical protein U1A77_17370 [Pirellulales bacterium]